MHLDVIYLIFLLVIYFVVFLMIRSWRFVIIAWSMLLLFGLITVTNAPTLTTEALMEVLLRLLGQLGLLAANALAFYGGWREGFQFALEDYDSPPNQIDRNSPES